MGLGPGPAAWGVASLELPWLSLALLHSQYPFCRQPGPALSPTLETDFFWVPPSQSFYTGQLWPDWGMAQVQQLPQAAQLSKKLSVVPNRFVQGKQYPIILGVQGGSSCLSCGTSAQPNLQLEQIMELFEDKEQAARFTFHNTPEGSTHRFESAAYPGWFLCTSQKNSDSASCLSYMNRWRSSGQLCALPV
uniref:Interleukin-1 n=1 Tax=Chrysemys picta bellii TaxID=8478 RepID=A0A8C3PCT9_CHRPI